MMVVGLTGGIGSGKTTVLNFFKDLDVPCYIADVEAKRLMNTSLEIKKDVIDLFGKDAYESGALNRKFISSIVFQNPKKLKLLNAIVHPRVFEDFQKFVKKSKSDYIIYESAILLDSPSKNSCDKIIVVTSPIKTRIERVIKRDETSEQLVLARMNQQLSEKKMIAKADFVINNTNLESTKIEVVKLNSIILQGIQNT